MYICMYVECAVPHSICKWTIFPRNQSIERWRIRKKKQQKAEDHHHHNYPLQSTTRRKKSSKHLHTLLKHQVWFFEKARATAVSSQTRRHHQHPPYSTTTRRKTTAIHTMIVLFFEVEHNTLLTCINQIVTTPRTYFEVYILNIYVRVRPLPFFIRAHQNDAASAQNTPPSLPRRWQRAQQN